MRASIVTVGDEILRGRTVDSNSTWISRELFFLGVEVVEHIVVSDKVEKIVAAINRQNTELIILTGGLGPTPDDITRNAIASHLGKELELRQEELDIIRDRFIKRGLELSPSNRVQAMIPEGARTIPNPVGMAPGIVAEDGHRTILSLPGVPEEMKAMLKTALDELGLKKQADLRVLRTAGIPESILFDMLDIEGYEDMIGFYPSLGFVDVVMKPELPDTTADGIEKTLMPYTYARQENMRIEEVIKGMMIDKGLMLCTAESCTGGMIASDIIDIPGSSAFFSGAAVTYSNEMKMQLLGVNEESLKKYGAVSKEVAREMAEGARDVMGVDIAISTTGIAGPEGGTEGKPVGLVYIALASARMTYVRRYNLSKTRQGNRRRATSAALYLLWLYLKEGLKGHEFLDGSEEA